MGTSGGGCEGRGVALFEKLLSFSSLPISVRQVGPVKGLTEAVNFAIVGSFAQERPTEDATVDDLTEEDGTVDVLSARDVTVDVLLTQDVTVDDLLMNDAAVVVLLANEVTTVDVLLSPCPS